MRRVFLLVITVLLVSCHSSKKLKSPASEEEVQNYEDDTVDEIPYRASYTKNFNLIHSDISIRFDWKKQEVIGNIAITLSPHFYPDNKLLLNAKGMEIRKVLLLSDDSLASPLGHHYLNDSLHIVLDKTYTRHDSLKIQVDYIARPEQLELRGSEYKTAKGLYFINPLGDDPNKPKQIWTQGETQASSCWFPTIDAPNQRMTQDIRITVENEFTTLSNGKLVASTINSDFTRTDHWKQTLPAAPYLTMIAVGNFVVVKDSLEGLELSYYVEPEYAGTARAIFGNTDEMMRFFSDVLDMPYLWEKYSQIVVRDYISGAMENSTAVVFGDFMYQDRREMLDHNFEEVISHELFHHWFGNLVTCESWANLPLNESFATYGEYLWNEHKYGRTTADHYGYNDLQTYIIESKSKQEPLIRYHYHDQSDMFDAHSYHKGGRVLHMLRKYVGDEAFFASLNLYLRDNLFKSVEIHDLRLAFEEVCGEDLNWFFDQWFLSSGHPFLDISYTYNDSSRMQSVIIEQLQVSDNTPLFRLPLLIDIYEREVPQRFKVIVDKPKQEFKFYVSSKPKLVVVDAEKMLLCEKIDDKSLEEFVFQYFHAPNYLDKREAISAVGRDYEPDGPGGRMIKKALSDPYWHLRLHAINQLDRYAELKPTEVKGILAFIATNDKKSLVRAEALDALAKYFPDDNSIEHVFKNAVLDSSYTVAKAGLMQFTHLSQEGGLQLANMLASSKNPKYVPMLSSIYSSYGDERHHDFYDFALGVTYGGDRYKLLIDYGSFLTRCSLPVIEEGLRVLKSDAVVAEPWHVRLAAVQALSELYTHAKNTRLELEEDLKREGSTSVFKQDAENLIGKYSKLESTLLEILKAVTGNEKDPRLLELYGRGKSGNLGN